MKKRVIKIVSIILIIMLSIGYGIGICKINSRYKVEVEEIPFGVTYEVIDGVKMKVNGYRCLDKEELVKAYDYMVDYEGDIKAILVSVTYRNESGQTKGVATYNNNIELVGYSNGIDPILYSVCNSFDLEFELKNGEEKDIILTYILLDFQFTDGKWKQIEEEEFLLSTSRYPVKTIWRLR